MYKNYLDVKFQRRAKNQLRSVIRILIVYVVQLLQYVYVYCMYLIQLIRPFMK